MTRTHTDRIDAAADALRRHEQGGRLLREWSTLPSATKRKWRDKARAIVTAYLGEDVVVPKEPTTKIANRTWDSLPSHIQRAFIKPTSHFPGLNELYRYFISAAQDGGRDAGQ